MLFRFVFVLGTLLLNVANARPRQQDPEEFIHHWREDKSLPWFTALTNKNDAPLRNCPSNCKSKPVNKEGINLFTYGGAALPLRCKQEFKNGHTFYKVAEAEGSKTEGSLTGLYIWRGDLRADRSSTRNELVFEDDTDVPECRVGMRHAIVPEESDPTESVLETLVGRPGECLGPVDAVQEGMERWTASATENSPGQEAPNSETVFCHAFTDIHCKNRIPSYYLRGDDGFNSDWLNGLALDYSPSSIEDVKKIRAYRCH